MVTITQERNALAKVGLTLRRREQWGARFNYTTSRPVDEPATRVFVHITITNPGDFSSNDRHARRVEDIGINRFPATGISYNRLVMPDGSLYEGQPMGRRGAHTVNDFKRSTCSTSGCPGRGSSLTAPSWNLNVNARAYVICQNTQHPVTDKMVDSLARAIAADKLAGMVTKSAAIHGHRCVSAKGCPGDRMWARMGELNQKVNRYVANGLIDTPPPPPPEGDVMTPEQEQRVLAAISATPDKVWKDKYLEYVDEDGNQVRDSRTTVDILYSTHKLAYLAANQNIDALAAAIVAKLPTGTTNGSEITAAVEKGLRNVLGSLDNPVNPT